MRTEPRAKRRAQWVTVREMTYVDATFPVGTTVDEVDPDDLNRSDADSYWRAIRREDRTNADQTGQVGRLIPVQAGDRVRFMRAGTDIQVPKADLRPVPQVPSADPPARPAPRGHRDRRV